MRAARFVPSLAALDQRQWEACFQGEIEGYDYHQGVEAAGLKGFALGWYVLDGDGAMICAVPVFESAYDLATTAQGTVRRVLTAVQPWVPGKLTLGLSCLGSPVTETCPIGFAPGLGDAAQQSALSELFAFWQSHAASRGFGLRGIKDMSDAAKGRFAPLLGVEGFCLVPSMPSASLAIDFQDIETYLARLSPATRKDMRRKLKSRPKLRVEDTRNITAVLPGIVDMYRETRARSDWAFEDLEPAYFANILQHSPEKAFFKLYWAGERLVGANLLLSDGNELLDKFFVMRGEEGRALNLYFVSWFENIAHCLAHRLKVYRSGQAGYETKLRLGSQLSKTWMGFRHQNPALHLGLKLAAPLLAVDQPETNSEGASRT